MPITHLLEDFSPNLTFSHGFASLTELGLEDERLASFEQGYTAGWDDAIRAQTDDQAKVTTALARNLEDLTFTYHEAYAQMLAAVAPVFDAIVRQLLPKILQDSLGAVILEELTQLAEFASGLPIEISSSLDQTAALEQILPPDFPIPVHVLADSTLTECQVFMRVGQQEREINFDALSDRISNSLYAFNYQIQKDLEHG